MKFANPLKKDKVVGTLHGHSILFPGKGSMDAKQAEAIGAVVREGFVFVFVPSRVRGEMVQHGMVPEEEVVELDDPKAITKPDDVEVLRKQVFEAFDMLVEVGQREDFGGHGVPKGQALEKLLGYAVTNNEVKTLWTEYQVDRKENGTS